MKTKSNMTVKDKEKIIEPFMIGCPATFSTEASYIGDCIKYAAKLIVKALKQND